MRPPTHSVSKSLPTVHRTNPSHSPPLAVMAQPPSRGVVVIKIGTSSVMRERGATDSSVSSEAASFLPPSTGELALSTLALVSDTLVSLRRAGHKVVLVSSGAVGVGCRELGVAVRPKVSENAGCDEKAAVMAKIQAFAAVGQSVLMRTYADMLRLSGQPCAQVLLTSQDLGSEYQYENAKNTLRALLDMGVVPIVNENDTTATEELKYGDNDWMSALVSTAVDAEWLFLLTDVDALYCSNPRTNPEAKQIVVVEDIDELDVDSGNAAAFSSPHGAAEPAKEEPKTGSQWGTGGMATKITAARLATAAGVRVALVHGRYPERVLDFVHGRPGRVGTVFEPKGRPMLAQREQWIAQCLPPRGSICLGEKAAENLRRRHVAAVKTTGIVNVVGVWPRNSAVKVCGPGGVEIARGVCCYGSGELQDFKGLGAGAMTRLLGTPTSDVVIHAHDLAILSPLERTPSGRLTSDGAVDSTQVTAVRSQETVLDNVASLSMK